MIENLTNLARDGTLTNQARAPVDEIVIDADTSKNIETGTCLSNLFFFANSTNSIICRYNSKCQRSSWRR